MDAGGDDIAVGVNRGNNVYCLKPALTMFFNGRGSATWTRLDGSLKYFSCGPYGCWGVNSGNSIYFNPVRFWGFK